MATLAVHSKTAANLEALKTNEEANRWSEMGASNMTCNFYGFPGGSSSNCPLRQQSAFSVFNKNGRGSFTLFAANTSLLEVPLIADRYGTVTYEKALLGCHTADQCKIDINSEKLGTIGSITVDMGGKMKILNITSTHPTYTVKQIESFNSVEINNSDVIGSLRIINNINSTLSATVNNVTVSDTPIASDEFPDVSYADKIFSDRVSENCLTKPLCDIDIITVKDNEKKASLLGTVTVNLDNKMEVVKVVPFRASEITLEQVDEATVKVVYPD